MNRLYHTSRLILASLAAGAAPMVLDYLLRNRKDFDNYEPPKEDSFYTRERQEAVLDAEQTLFERGQGVRYYIFLASDPDTIVGNISLAHTDGPVCILGYRIDMAYRRQGIASEALSFLIPCVFKESRVSMIEADIYPDNTISADLAIKLGFHRSGHTMFRGRVIDRFIMSLRDCE